MKNPDKIFGRMGNRMFQMAALYSFAKKYNNGDFFFCDPKWFEEYEHDIRMIYGDGILGNQQIPKVAIHVRRGDYLRPPHNSFHFPVFETDFYEKAVKEFPTGTEYLIFCADRSGEEYDKADKEWCIDYFTKLIGRENFELADYPDGITDMNMMALCEHQIIANSSFSWWAAFLNPNPNKLVIAPDETQWYYDGEVKIKLPQSWKQIKINRK